MTPEHDALNVAQTGRMLEIVKGFALRAKGTYSETRRVAVAEFTEQSGATAFLLKLLQTAKADFDYDVIGTSITLTIRKPRKGLLGRA